MMMGLSITIEFIGFVEFWVLCSLDFYTDVRQSGNLWCDCADMDIDRLLSLLALLFRYFLVYPA